MRYLCTLLILEILLDWQICTGKFIEENRYIEHVVQIDSKGFVVDRDVEEQLSTLL